MAAVTRKNTPSILNIAELHARIDKIEDYNERIYAAARWYAENQVMIAPFRPGDANGDYAGFPKGLSQRHATYKMENIEAWWHPETGKYPGASIAMAHGGQSGYCAIDLDVKGDIDGIQNLADLQAAYGSYDDGEGEDLQTLMAVTPSGGRHLVFKYHPEIISNSEMSYPGIDTRGGLKKNPVENGGITFVEPSKKLSSDGFYRWDSSVTEIREIPDWLVDVLNGREPAKRGGIKLQDAYIQSAAGDHGDGRDRNIYMDLMRFVGIGYTEAQLWDLMPQILERMDPPDEDMVRRKIESVIQSDAFTKSKEESTTKKQVESVKLIRDNKERIVKCIENLQIIIESPLFEHEFGVIEYDDFTQSFIRDKKPMAAVVDWALAIQLWIARKFKLDFPKTDVRDRVESTAYTNPHANIAKEYMLTCPRPPMSVERDRDFWGSGRLGPGPAFYRLCYEVLGLDQPLHPNYDETTQRAYEGFLWFWLQGVVARACVPGCKMEIVLNIFGSQGIGKSLFFRDLCPNPTWFTDSIQDSIVGGGQNNRDELLKLMAKIIVEMPELNPVKRGGKSADDKLKQFISTQVDNFRRAYGTDSVDHPRTCALAGTANNRDVYRDPTGDRRFVSIDHGNTAIRVGDLDTGVMDQIRDYVWGEVVSSFKPTELDSQPNRLLVAIPYSLREFQNSINNHHRFEEIGIQEVVEWLKDKSRVTWEEIVYQAKTVPGLRDCKESVIITAVRKELSANTQFQFKKRQHRLNVDGGKEKTNFWVNTELPIEANHKPGMAVPPHWSNYVEQEEDENPEY